MANGQQHYAWGLHSRTLWLDDMMGEFATILDLLAPHAVGDGFAGYCREELDPKPTLISLADGAYDFV